MNQIPFAVATHKHIAELIDKHRSNTISEQEMQELEAWRQLSEQNKLLFERMSRDGSMAMLLVDVYSSTIDEENGKLRALYVPRRKRLTRIIKNAAIVAGLLLTAMAVYFVLYSGAGKANSVDKTAAGSNVNALPDVYRVTLTLANGKTVYLDSSVNGYIGLQYRSVIYKEGNVLRYEWSTGNAQPAVEYNTITTPRKRRFTLELPDGSKAWLNAASSITYPTAFTGKERTVQVTGEVYFEVNPNPASLEGKEKKPFIVYVKPLEAGKGASAKIEVLGTHFNINAYGDEPAIRTTLLEGKVKVSNSYRLADVLDKGMVHPQAANGPAIQSAELKPGQQAVVNGNGQLDIVRYADIQQVMAWRKDLFVFNDVDIKQIMQQLARMYDLEVEFREPVEGLYTLSQTRQTAIDKILEGLELAGGVHFKIAGRKIIVSQ